MQRENGQYLIFRIGSENYGLEILEVQETRGCDADITAIANAPAFIGAPCTDAFKLRVRDVETVSTHVSALPVGRFPWQLCSTFVGLALSAMKGPSPDASGIQLAASFWQTVSRSSVSGIAPSAITVTRETQHTLRDHGETACDNFMALVLGRSETATARPVLGDSRFSRLQHKTHNNRACITRSTNALPSTSSAGLGKPVF
ncbi:chemotaxis protein CheW [Paraburkholderia phymatum]